MRVAEPGELTKPRRDGMRCDVEGRTGPDRRRADPRLASATSDTCVENMSSRAAWSPPEPIIPTSSP